MSTSVETARVEPGERGTQGTATKRRETTNGRKTTRKEARTSAPTHGNTGGGLPVYSSDRQGPRMEGHLDFARERGEGRGEGRGREESGGGVDGTMK